MKNLGQKTNFYMSITAFNLLSQNEKDKLNISRTYLWKNKLTKILCSIYSAVLNYGIE